MNSTHIRSTALCALVSWLFVNCANGLSDNDTFANLAEVGDASSQVLGVDRVDAGRAGQTTNDASVDHEEGGAAFDSGATDASADVDASPVVTAPIVDGIVQPGEYGVHTNGQNQQVSDPNNAASTTWYMMWTDTHLHVAVAAANVAEGVVLYIDHAPLTPSTGGTNADGSLTGALYDTTKAAALPFRADFVAYVKAGYNEYRTTDGMNGWSAQVPNALAVQGAGALREIAIPWSVIRAGGRPSSFAWFGYATSAKGYVYGVMPPSNPQGNQVAAFGFFFQVTDATPNTGTKPFANLSP